MTLQRTIAGVQAAAFLLFLVGQAAGQPSADQVLTDLGIAVDQKQRVLNGEFVTGTLDAASERDLAVSMAFLVRASPAELSDDILAGDLVAEDSQAQAHGAIPSGASLADFTGVPMSASTAQAFLNARPGEALNLATAEIAAFNAQQGGAAPQQAAQGQLRSLLLARLQAYRASGLAGIAPYARAGGKQIDVGGELRKATEAARGLAKYLPAFQAVLLGYPKATIPTMRESWNWVAYDIDGTATYALVHLMAAPDGDARVVAQRQYYVSTGYNAEQAVAALLPVQQGTLVVYATHTFTDQVTGFGGAMKRSIGRRMMSSRLEALFRKAQRALPR